MCVVLRQCNERHVLLMLRSVAQHMSTGPPSVATCENSLPYMALNATSESANHHM